MKNLLASSILLILLAGTVSACDFIVWNNDTDELFVKGQILAVMPDNQVWGKMEQYLIDRGDFKVYKHPELTIEQGSKYTNISEVE